jgi:hypothetical protein
MLIRDSDKKIIGEMRPLVPNDLDEMVIIEEIAAARNFYIGCFLTQTTSDVESTKAFLREYLTSDSKFLFLIFEIDSDREPKRFFGHIGYEHLSGQSTEIVSVMKIPSNRLTMKMEWPLRILLKHLRRNKSDSRICLRVLKTNEKAISLYKKCGFSTSIDEKFSRHTEMILTSLNY